MLRFIIGVVLITAVASAAPVLFEAYQEDLLSIPTGSVDTLEVIQIDFSVDSACAVLFTAGGRMNATHSWLALDGIALHPVMTSAAAVSLRGISLSYISLLSSGEHILSLKYAIMAGAHNPAKCQ